MNILIDVDGVLADFIGAWLDVFNGVTAEWDVAPVLREHVDGMRIHECKEILKRQEEVRERGGEDALEMTGQLVNDFGFCTNIDRYPWAKELVQELRDLGRVRFVTHPLEGHRTWAFERDRWLVRHFGAKLHEVMHVRDKSLVAGSVLIEDNVHNARWWSISNVKTSIVLEGAHNRSDIADATDHVSKGMILVANSAYEVVEHVKQLVVIRA